MSLNTFCVTGRDQICNKTKNPLMKEMIRDNNGSAHWVLIRMFSNGCLGIQVPSVRTLVIAGVFISS